MRLNWRDDWAGILCISCFALAALLRLAALVLLVAGVK